MAFFIAIIIGIVLILLTVLFRIAVVIVPFIFMGYLIYYVGRAAYRFGKRQERKERRRRRWARIRAERQRREEGNCFQRPA